VQRIGRAARETVGGLPTAFWWLWTGNLITRAGSFVLPFLAFYLTHRLGYSPSFAGLVLGAFGLGGAAASLVGGVLADRLGRRPVLFGSQVATAVTLLVLAHAQGRPALLLLAPLLGLVSNMSRPAYSAMMVDIVPPADRVRAFSLHYWSVNLGFAVAAVLAGLLARSGYQTLFLVDAATTFAFALLVFLRVPESRPEPRPGPGSAAGSMRDVLRDRVFMAFTLLTFGMAMIFMQHMSTLPVQMGDDGLSPAQYGTVIGLNGMLIVLVTVPLSRWLQRFARSRVLALGTVVTGLGFAATAWAHSPGAYAATVVVWTVGEVVGATVGPAVVADLSPATMRGRYQGVFSFAFSAAALVAPVLGGAVYDARGGTALWVACGLLGLATGAGHLAIAPARRARLAQLRRDAGQTGHAPTDAVPVPVARTVEEADEAVS
jgi:MFS family permease